MKSKGIRGAASCQKLNINNSNNVSHNDDCREFINQSVNDKSSSFSHCSKNLRTVLKEQDFVPKKKKTFVPSVFNDNVTFLANDNLNFLNNFYFLVSVYIELIYFYIFNRIK